MSAILLALQEEEYGNFSTENLIGDTKALSAHMDRVQVEPKVKKDRVIDQFRLIVNRPHLSSIDPRLGKSPLRYFAEYLHSQILTAICTNSPI